MGEMPKTLQLFIDCVVPDSPERGFKQLVINGHTVYRWYHVPRDFYPELQRHCRSTAKRKPPERAQIWIHLKSQTPVTILHANAKLEWTEEVCVVYLHTGPDSELGKEDIWIRPLDKFMQRFKRVGT